MGTVYMSALDKRIDVRGAGVWLAVIWAAFLAGCRPEIPVLSSITIDAEAPAMPVNPDLYGLTVEEINRAIDGGLYAELIRNRSFEEGVPPLNCPYDRVRNVLVTPNGWSVPFVRPDSVPGWRRLSAGSYLVPDGKELINDKNKRSLFISAYVTPELGRAGAVAEGYRGISIRKGEKYRLSLFAKGASMLPKTMRIGLEDSLTRRKVSDVFELAPAYQWGRYRHTFTATEDLDNAVLTLWADSSAMFWVDVVSLFPEKTWKGRARGLRADLAEMIADLHPRFIRFPGGSFVEGYTAGTYPVWRETIGDIAERKHFWNVWAYGSTGGMGYHEFLQFCEDVGAQPVYVVNSGLTSQSRRPRYEDITAMDKLVQEALDAIAYARAPADSALGAFRAAAGHPEPFDLKYIQIGSENYGQEYAKRFELFRQAIKAAYPDMTVISSSAVSKRSRGDWADSHWHANATFFAGAAGRFEAERYRRRGPGLFIGEFGTTDLATAGTLGAAVGEACFLVGVENNPETVRRLAYAPVLGNVGYALERYPLILFDNHRAVATPSYYLWQLFASHRGDEGLKTSVETYLKPQVTFGRAGVELFDNSFELADVAIDGKRIEEAQVLTGGCVVTKEAWVPEANRWNYVLGGDSAAYNYTFTLRIRRTKGSGGLQVHVRDRGRLGEQADYIAFTWGAGGAGLFRQAGGVRDSLATPRALPLENNRWYTVRVECAMEKVRCFVDEVLVQEGDLRSLPSLAAVATRDTAQRVVWLKVVNTTRHEEKTELRMEGLRVKNEADVIELAGLPQTRNSFANPRAVAPASKRVSFSLSGPMVYAFPPTSVTILRLEEE